MKRRRVMAKPGKKLGRVVCDCGVANWFYVWSWAGNGKARCCGCGKWIPYLRARS